MNPMRLPAAARISIPRPGRKRSMRRGAVRIDLEKGVGDLDFLLVPGLVPDGPETFLRQKRLLLARGNTYTVTYPYETFELDEVIELVGGFCRERAKGRRKPVLFGVSVGGGVVLEALRRAREAGEDLPLHGLVLASPLPSTDDLAPILRKLWVPIVSDTGDPERALERGRSFFKSLASRSAAYGSAARLEGWRTIVAMFTPQGWQEIRERSLRRRIDATLNLVPPSGAIARCKALSLLRGLGEPKAGEALTRAPSLVLWGSKERHTIDIEGPNASRLCRPDLASRDLPSSVVQWVYSHDGEEVPHASLLKHAAAYNRLLAPFLRRIAP